MRSMQKVLVTTIISGVAWSGLPAIAAPKLPVESFASRPLVQRMQLSPDGQKVAMMVNNEGTTSILVQNLASPGAKPVGLMSTDHSEYSFNWFRWVNNDRVLVGTIFPTKRTQNSNSTAGGVRLYDTRLLSAKADGSQVINLVNPASFKGFWLPQFQDQVIDFEPDGGRHVLLQLNVPQQSVQSEGIGHDPEVYRVNVDTGSRSQVHDGRDGFNRWLVDRDHRVRMGIRRDKADIEVHACDPDGKNWRKLWSYKVLSKAGVSPIGFGKDPNQLFVLADFEGRRALFTVDLRDPALKQTLKLSDKVRDIEGSLVYSRKTGEAVGLGGSTAQDAAAVNYWDKDRRELVSFIDQALPNRFNRIINLSDDETRYLVFSSNGRAAGQFYVGDDRANTLKLLAQSYATLPEADMVAKQSVKIKARDGLELPGFLSLPQGAVSTNLPTVLLVHGGPQWRDNADFDVWAQFLANRGYAVLQVNFRGSTGYGHGLLAAGLRRWGLEMQDDLADAAQWVVARGTADPKRMCIVGASFGGYAALMGVAKTPDQFRCSVSFAGVSDLTELIRDQALFQGGKDVAEIQIGSLDTDKDRLKATSPRYLATQIKVPVLLIHGTEDRSVAFEQGQFMDAALSAAGKPHRFIKQERGDHHLSLYAHSLQFFRELEGFLAQNLAP